VGVVWKRGCVLVDRRPPEGLLGGLWEFPGGKRRRGESREACVGREVIEELGVRARVRERFAVVRHAYSHFRVTIHAFECEYVSGRPRAIGCSAWKWVRPRDLGRYAFPAANRRIIARIAPRDA
jgi:A/G-specific adenine glycosylase